jgi:hypothetical protein
LNNDESAYDTSRIAMLPFFTEKPDPGPPFIGSTLAVCRLRGSAALLKGQYRPVQLLRSLIFDSLTAGLLGICNQQFPVERQSLAKNPHTPCLA